MLLEQSPAIVATGVHERNPNQKVKVKEKKMKSLCSMLSAVLMSLATLAFAQSDAHMSSAAPVPSEAQKSFTTMKSLA